MSVKTNLQKILTSLDSVQLVAVTKYAAPEQIQELLDCGHFILGENKVQSAALKAEQYKQYPVQWHLLGHLQTNKAKQAVRIFEVIQSVDSPKIAAAIDHEAAKINKRQKIFVQVNIGREPQKSGIAVELLADLLVYCRDLKNIRLWGLMAIAPNLPDKEQTRPYFKEMKELFDRYAAPYGLEFLSLGMSGDYPSAVQEGANMVRIGSKLFEE
ncbi:pyridoxal phosphate enzyme YggS family [Candidatus Termititenax persephonae]|uniref:Pyridoxal phosphate homeostasis protein n=1 Tax=Candidatus Termititenax persephonae TaxID=2218525 RepID=A0A388TIT8_9BACT|nr:pyridoxal phosphate enzyme YggS family [Candidatus Termititenax persephonae]